MALHPALCRTWSALAGQPTGPLTVATFAATAGFPAPDPAGYTALVSWGDGPTQTIANIALNSSTKTLSVMTDGHTYAVAGTFKIAVTISDAQAFVVGTSDPNIQVVVPITGQLSPQSDTGTPMSANVTRDTTPMFVGTATAGTTIQVFAAPSGSGTSPGSMIAQTTTNAYGYWAATVPNNSPLANGGYAITAQAVNSQGILLGNASLGSVIIDTLGPQVSSLNFNRTTGTLTVGFIDSLGGLNLQSLTDPAFYRMWAKALTNPRVRIPTALVPTSLSVTPSAGQPNSATVTVVFNYGHSMKNGTYTLEIASNLAGGASLVDTAGNPLAGTYRGGFPSGSGQPSGAFVAIFTTSRTTIRKPAPTRNGYVPPFPVSGSLARIAEMEARQSVPLAVGKKRAAVNERIHDEAIEALAHETDLKRRRAGARAMASPAPSASNTDRPAKRPIGLEPFDKPEHSRSRAASELPAALDRDFSLGLAAARAEGFDLLYHVRPVGDLAKDHMFAIEPVRDDGRDEEL